MKFYKFINENKKHFGIALNPGVITDPLSKAEGSQPVGLYFASKDIIHYLLPQHGYVSEVTLIPGVPLHKEIMERVDGFSVSYYASTIELGEFKPISIETLSPLIDPIHLLRNSTGSNLISWAIRHKDLDLQIAALHSIYLEPKDAYGYYRLMVKYDKRLLNELLEEFGEFILKKAIQVGDLEVIRSLVKDGHNIYLMKKEVVAWKNVNNQIYGELLKLF